MKSEIEGVCESRGCKAIAKGKPYMTSGYKIYSVDFSFSDNMGKTEHFDCYVSKGGMKAFMAMARQCGISFSKTLMETFEDLR
jgi:hypothetical protein